MPDGDPDNWTPSSPDSAWLMGDVELDLIFDVESGSMWDTAIRRLGADPSTLQTSHRVH